MRKVLLFLLVACRSPSAALNYDGPRGLDGEVGLGGLDTKLANAMLASYHRQVEHAPPPLSLVPTDGSELELRALSADVTLEGPLAHTELHLTFHNPEARVREGRFAITLPSDAAVARFAMKTEREWREARVVTRATGRRVYESYLHKKVDPALLEQDLGNAFSARVFPIAANADKEIIIAYDHRVSEVDPYTLALRGLPRIANLAISVAQDGTHTSRAEHDVVPQDVVVPVAGGNDAVSAAGAFVARVELDQIAAQVPVQRAMILVDTSASRATIMGRQASVVQQLLAGFPADAQVIVATFDQGVTELYRGNAHEAGAELVTRLQAHGALGASDLGGALAIAGASGMARVIVVGDGAPTLGEHEPSKLAQIVHDAKLERLDAIQVGASIDRTTLAPIVAAGRAPGAILDARDLAAVTRGLATAVPGEQAIVVDGALETWPATTRGLAPGQPAWVVGKRAAGRTGDALAIRIGTHATTVQPHPAELEHVQRAVAIAEVADLTDRVQRAPEAARPALESQLETIALEHKLVSSRTSLLVLESDADEERMLGPAPATVQTPPQTSPTIDPASTHQGITIDKNYIQNIPVPGRTFESALGTAAGSQADTAGTAFSGATSLENQSYVDGINETRSGGESIMIRSEAPDLVLDAVAAGASPELMVRHMQDQALAEHHEREPPRPAATDDRLYATPYTGPMADVMTSLGHNKRAHALEVAARWQLASPGEVAAIMALGEALEARGSNVLAARAYGSVIDLYPNRAELLRAAGERLDRVAGGRALAIDAYRRAIRERPDQASTYRLLAYDLMRDNNVEAMHVIADAVVHATRGSVIEILEQDSAIIASYLLAHRPSEKAAILALRRRVAPMKASLRFVLSWETDGNDVDLHVRDNKGAHAFYSSRSLPSGGALLDDVTDGYGPEIFEVDEPRAAPYRIGVHYYARGPEGVGLGSVQVIRSDGAGHVSIEDRPFVIQNDNAYVDLGAVE